MLSARSPFSGTTRTNGYAIGFVNRSVVCSRISTFRRTG
jgi:hypothetical protein